MKLSAAKNQTSKKSIMKNGVIALSLAIAGLTASVASADHTQFYDYGRVLTANPIYQTLSHKVPTEQCWTERVSHERNARQSATAPIVGGIIGAAIGNRLGHNKSNKKVGAVAGAILGASIGHDIGQNRQRGRVTEFRDIERCETVYTVEQHRELIGYDVRYRYQGQVYQTQTASHPGKQIKLGVSVSPVS